MANTLTNLMPDIYAAAAMASRELIGLIPAVFRDPNSEKRAGAAETIRSVVVPAGTAATITPGQFPADNGDNTITNVSLTMSNQRYVPMRWSGEESKGVDNGPMAKTLRIRQMAEAFRTLTNEIEEDLGELAKLASRAVAPAGTILFDAANYKDLANVRQVLVENGAPANDLHLVLNTTAAAGLRGSAQYVGVNTSGNESFLQQGVLYDIQGVRIRESGSMYTHTAGTASSATVDASGYAIGATVLTLSSVGTGTILVGDVLTFVGDANKYVVTSGDADVSGGGTITLAAPGLRVAMTTSTVAITEVDQGQRNMAFSSSAILLATRLPARPVEGDLAIDSTVISDPVSGLAFELSVYPEYRRVRYELAIIWGSAVVRPEHLALLID